MRIKKANTFQWDANGNMTQQGINIYLQWDEENRLKGVTKPAQGVCFAYDASGERFYKNSGERIYMLVNGSFYMKIPYYQNPVLYTSPYMVVTPNGYTKHYFVENERFASRIGDGNITGLNSHATTNAALVAKQAVVDFYAPDSIPPGQFYNFRTLPAHWSSRHTTYWQHSDHLGSASWVTDTTGRGYEHFQYNAWGGPFITQRITGGDYQSRYTFSSKERDEETEYSYFGARYYNSALSIWLSVDPMSDKYPGVSPYTYCANNPVKLIDPNGREFFDDIVIHGKNNSSLTIKTDIINQEFNVDYDFGGNKTIDASNVAIGYQVGVTASADAVVGTSYGGYIQSALFLGGDYAGYWYDYAGGNAQIDVTTSLNLSAGVQKSWFLAIYNGSQPITPEGFAGQYIGSNLSVSGKFVIGGSVNASYSISKDKTWETYSLGVSVSFGGQVGAGAGAGINVGGTKLIGNAKPTSDRTLSDKIRNWAIHIF